MLSLSSQWRLALGARCFQTKARYYSYNDHGINLGQLSYLDRPCFKTRKVTTVWILKAQVGFLSTHLNNFFLNVSQGYRASQVNPNAGLSLIEPKDVNLESGYDADSTVTIEFNHKGQLFKGNLHIYIRTFHIDRQLP